MGGEHSQERKPRSVTLRNLGVRAGTHSPQEREVVACSGPGTRHIHVGALTTWPGPEGMGG